MAFCSVSQAKSRYHKGTSSHNIPYESAHRAASTHEKSSNLLDVFCAPIVFSETGFRCFIKHRYNRSEYTDFLALSLRDMTAFLVQGQHQQSREYPKRIISLFHKKLKTSSYVNAFALLDLIKEMPHLMKHYFTLPRHQEAILHDMMNKFLYTAFLHNFDEFKQEPENFLENLSRTLAMMALQSIHTEETTTEEELRAITIRFLEQALDKLIWSPEENEAIWQSVKDIALALAEFAHQGIFIYEEDLDDLYWSLISRFGYFVDLAGAQLPVEAYSKMHQEINKGELDFLTLDEQEEHVETKTEYLARIIQAGSIKAQGYSMGYINEIIAT